LIDCVENVRKTLVVIPVFTVPDVGDVVEWKRVFGKDGAVGDPILCCVHKMWASATVDRRANEMLDGVVVECGSVFIEIKPCEASGSVLVLC
jgi:hypothetical protein